MTRLLMSLILLLCVPLVGWAGEPMANCLANNSLESEECRRQAAKAWIDWAYGEQIVQKPDCLATMEQAMKAMEPFLSGENWQRELDILYATQRNDFEKFLEYRNALVQRRDLAYKRWAEAKTCWRKP